MGTTAMGTSTISTTSRAVDGRRQAWLAFALVLAVLAIEMVALAHVPFVSEDWTQMSEMRAVPSFLGALDPGREPLRPFQHAFFWVITHCGGDPTEWSLPFFAHAFGFALHGASCMFVWLLAREAGVSRNGALAACVTFALFPNVKTLAWAAAIGTPGRTCFELAALWLLASHARSPRPGRAALGLLAFALALGFHESAMLLSAILVLWIVFVHGATLRDGLARLRAASRDPWLLGLAFLAAAYAVQLVLRPQRHHALKSFASLPANVVKAETALAPEWWRTLVVDGFRAGAAHTGAFCAAAIGFVAIAVLAAVLLRRSQVARFVVLACAIDLGLAVLGAGFVQRYASWSSALVAVGLGIWVGRHPGAWRSAVLLVVGMSWAWDTALDVRDLRRLGPQTDALLHDMRTARARAGDDVPIAVVDPADMIGAEHDIPLFNWGLDFLAEAHGIPGPWLLWRTGPYATGTNVELVDRSRVDAERASGRIVVDAAEIAGR
jgi:hypothetical protein